MQLADLAVEQRPHVRVLVRLDPVLVLADVKRHGRVDDGNVLAVDLRCLLLLERRHRLVYLRRRQTGGLVHRRAALHLRVLACGADLVAVLHVLARSQRVADELVLRGARRRAQLLGRAEDHVVDRVQLQLVGHRDVGAVLHDGARHARLAELLSRRDHALLQRRRIRQRVPLAPLDTLAAALRQRLLSGELRVDQIRPRVLQQLRVVVGLHRRREIVRRRERRLVSRVCVYVGIGRIDESTCVRRREKYLKCFAEK